MKQLTASRDKNSTPLWQKELTDEGWTGRVAADTDILINVPVGAAGALVTADDHYFISATAITLPSVGVVSKTNAEMNADQITITVETELHVRGRNAMDFSISFWS